MSGFCKYYKQKKQVSYNNGLTWQDVIPYEYQRGALYESNSADCGYEQLERWINSGTTCSGSSGYDKYYIQVKQTSTDGGQTWITTSDSRLGDLIEINSTDCGYIPPTHDYSQDYLTFVATESGTFKFITNVTDHDISYSIDSGETWHSYVRNYNTPTISAGSKIMWKGKGVSGKFSSSGNFTVEGNIMSYIYGDNFRNQTSLSGYSFNTLFKGCTGMTSAENLVFPATTLQVCCNYAFMFSGCTSLTTAPRVLPATTLADSCYQEMFAYCTSLTTAPELPATTLASGCYQSMFKYCASLTTAPELPATTLQHGCYRHMFYGCTSLTTAPSLPATTLEMECYRGMFSECSALTTAPELPATTLAESGYSGMFADCTSLTTAPRVLPATTLANSCYASMFARCTSLTTAPSLPATTLLYECYDWMFNGCTNLNSITCLATDISANFCTYGWVSGVASSGTFTKAASMTSWATGNSGIPDGWTVQNA